MYTQLLKQIQQKKQPYGLGLQPPAIEGEILNLKKSSKENLGYVLDESYAKFLRITNGLDWNGFSIYATIISPIVGYNDLFIDGFVEANFQYWELDLNRPFITFGQTGDARYVLNSSKMKFEEIDSVGLDLIELFPSFDEMICHLLKRSLA